MKLTTLASSAAKIAIVIALFVYFFADIHHPEIALRVALLCLFAIVGIAIMKIATISLENDQLPPSQQIKLTAYIPYAIVAFIPQMLTITIQTAIAGIVSMPLIIFAPKLIAVWLILWFVLAMIIEIKMLKKIITD